jgi:hypothetical protein
VAAWARLREVEVLERAGRVAEAQVKLAFGGVKDLCRLRLFKIYWRRKSRPRPPRMVPGTAALRGGGSGAHSAGCGLVLLQFGFLQQHSANLR